MFDEGLPPRGYFVALSKLANISHISHDYGLAGMTDEDVYQKACQEKRVLVTFNVRHFKPLITPTGSSVIGLSMKLKSDALDAKLTEKMRLLEPAELLGRAIKLN